MIANDLYTTDEYSIYTSPSGDNLVSLPFNQLTDFPSIDTSSYYLGWISSDDLPVFSRMCDVEDMGDGVFRFYDTTDTDNFPVGYIVTNTYDDSAATFLENDEIPKNAGGTYSRLYNDYRFINQLYPVDSAFKFTSNTSLGFYAFVHGESGVVRTYLSDIKHNGADITTITELLKLLKYPDYEITATVGNYGTITFTAADWDSGFPDMFTTSTGANVRLFFITFGLLGDYYIKNASSGTTTVRIRPFVRATAGNTSYHKTLCYPAISGSIDIARVDRWGQFSWRSYSTGGSFKKISAGMSGTVDTSTVTSTTGYTFDGNVLAYYNDRNIDICPILTLADVRKCFAMQFRIDSRPTTLSYVDGITFATDVTSGERFKAEYKTGDLEDTAYRDSLRPWQYENFQENEFTEDDVPPYSPEPEPGGDTPGDEPQDLPHDDGDPPDLQKDRTIGVPAMFITQYALTSAELQTVGSNLWTTWLTPNTDIWKNFFLPYAQDFGTLNIGAALDFIVSLKVFPFEFTIDYYTPANGVRMGTGHTDFLGGSAPVVNSQIICIDAGSVKVELPNPYNDFRDMYNCSALCLMPYCGTVELNLQEILGRTLKASYFIDLQSGGCTCVIECEGDAGDYVIASKTGQIGFTLPMTATNAGQLAAQAMGDATKVISTLSGFYFDAGKTMWNNLSSLASAQLGKKIPEKSELPLLSGNTFETNTKLGQSAVNTGLSLANQALDMLSRSAVDMPMLSGGGSAESFMFPECVSIQIRRGKYKKPDNYPHSVGHYNLSSHPISYFKGAFTGTPDTGSNTGKGFCTFVGIDTSGLDCRDDERAEIISLLESGVYL